MKMVLPIRVQEELMYGDTPNTLEYITELRKEMEKLRWMLQWGYQHEVTERTYDEWSAYLERSWEEHNG